MPNFEILNNQKRLSEQLQLLQLLEFSDPHNYSQDHNHHKDIRILDTIAVALATGKHGEVFAAAFDKRQTVMLVLAKNNEPTMEDKQAALDLFAAVTKHEDTLAVLPLLFSRCQENINKRVRKLREAVDEFSRELGEELDRYSKVASSVKEEFPRSDIYRGDKYPDSDPPFSQMMLDLLMDMGLLAEKFNFNDVDATKNIYLQLVYLANIVQKSRFLRWLQGNAGRKWKDRTEKLKRRLAKLCQYYFGVTDLMKYAKRVFSDGFNHCWVNDMTGSSETSGTTLQLTDNPIFAASDAYGIELSEVVQRMLRDIGPLPYHWRKELKPQLHAEIRIVLHLNKLLDPSNDERPIGCSKRSCLCCTLWIGQYNGSFGTRYLTTHSHGKPCATWAFPGAAYEDAHGVDSVNEVVMREVAFHLKQWLPQLSVPSKKVSGDERSSGSENESNQVESMRMLGRHWHICYRSGTGFGGGV